MQRYILGPVEHLKMDLFARTANGFKLKLPFICAKECSLWGGTKYSSDQFKCKQLIVSRSLSGEIIKYSIWNLLWLCFTYWTDNFQISCVLSFVEGIMCVPKKSIAPHLICASRHARSGVNCPDPLLHDHIFVKINLQLINSNN